MRRTVVAHPTISQVYAAFSDESHYVFQAAMARSRGGVVRVQDLLAALFARHADVGRVVLPERWQLPASGIQLNGDPLVPMANEPALRDVLRAAYLIAQAQPSSNGTTVTPTALWAAVIVTRQTYCQLTPRQIFARLDLCCPSFVRMTTDRRGLPPQPESSASRMEPETLPNQRDLIDVVLARWLAVQALPKGSERDHEIAQIARLTGQLESQP